MKDVCVSGGERGMGGVRGESDDLLLLNSHYNYMHYYYMGPQASYIQLIFSEK